MSYQQPRSPELRHPVPTHPAYIPEPPTTPNSPQGYQRFASSPPHGSQPPHQQPQPFAPASYGQGPGYGAPQQGFGGGQQAQHPAFSQPMGTMGQGTPSGRMGGMGAMGGVPAPDYGAWGMNDATAQFGMQLGQSAVQAGQQYVQKNFGIFVPGLPALKHHFNVSSSYVSTKLLLVLFPWKHRSWTRKLLRSDAVSASGPNGTPVNAPTVEWVPPREDVNSPDLYIPSMALVTYILLAALQSGLQERFHPEILGYSASKALAVVIADYVFVKCGCYFLNIQGTAQSFDLVSYGGYKFVGVILVVIAGLLNVGRLVYTIVFAYAFLSNAFFLLRSLRQVVLTDPNTSPSHAGTVNQAQRKRRITFLFLVAVSQIVYMGILVRV